MSAWQIKADFRDFVVRNVAGTLEISEHFKSRGLIADRFLDLRRILVQLRAELPPPSPSFDEPFAEPIDRIRSRVRGRARGAEEDIGR